MEWYLVYRLGIVENIDLRKLHTTPYVVCYLISAKILFAVEYKKFDF